MQTQVDVFMNPGLPGQVADIGPSDIVTRINAGAAAQGFGVFVTAGPVQGQALPPALAVDITGIGALGVVVRSHTQPRTEGYQPTDPMPVMKKGRIWVTVEDAVAAEAAAFVRFVIGVPGQVLGAFRSNVDGGNAAALPNAKFVTTQAVAGGLALLDLNIT